MEIVHFTTKNQIVLGGMRMHPDASNRLFPVKPGFNFFRTYQIFLAIKILDLSHSLTDSVHYIQSISVHLFTC